MDQLQGIEIEVVDFDEKLAEINLKENDFSDSESNKDGLGEDRE